MAQTGFPVEVSGLSTHVNLNFLYAEYLGAHQIKLGVEGQLAIFDRFEMGVMIPLLVHGWRDSSSETVFGNILLNLKLKLMGSSSGPAAYSLYFNTELPTTSAHTYTREYAGIQGGLAATGRIGMLTFGGNTGPWSFIVEGEGTVLYQIDFFFGVRPHRIIGIQLAMQVGIPLYEAGGEVAFVLTPAVQLWPVGGLHIDLGSRIAVTDFGRLYTSGGRATLQAVIGHDF